MSARRDIDHDLILRNSDIGWPDQLLREAWGAHDAELRAAVDRSVARAVPRPADSWRGGAGRIPVHGLPKDDGDGSGLIALLAGYVLGFGMGIGGTLLMQWIF